MFNNLFINALILISFTFMGGHLLKEIPKSEGAKVYFKILLGICGGSLGVLMIIYNIKVAKTTTLLDLRVLSLMMINYVGGFLPTLVAGIAIGVFRVGYYGVNESSILAIIDIILFLASFYIINKLIKTSWKNWFVKLSVSVVILMLTFTYALRDTENVVITVLGFISVVLCAGTLEYFLLEYARGSNELYRKYKKCSEKDHLTGLNNTRSFDQLLNTSFNKAVENSEKLSCLMIDIDYFKQINDTYGHAVGDIVLKEVADILKKNCRSFDVIARIGGEEFSILLLDCPIIRSFEIAHRIRTAIKEHKIYIEENNHISITVSIGIATYPDTIAKLDEIMKEADAALYKAKRTGRDRVCGNNYE